MRYEPATERAQPLAGDPEIKALVKQARAEEASAAFTLHNLSDDALANYVKHQRRAVEDGKGGRKYLAYGKALQHWRFRLRMRYGARDRYGAPGERGTDSYDRYYRLNEPPSYELAWALDHSAARFGRRHVFPWSDAA